MASSDLTGEGNFGIFCKYSHMYHSKSEYVQRHCQHNRTATIYRGSHHYEMKDSITFDRYFVTKLDSSDLMLSSVVFSEDDGFKIVDNNKLEYLSSHPRWSLLSFTFNDTIFVADIHTSSSPSSSDLAVPLTIMCNLTVSPDSELFYITLASLDNLTDEPD